MRIPFDTATSAQLRQYLKETHDVERHPNSGTASLLKLIRELGVTGDTFELQHDPEVEAAPAAPAAQEATPAAPPPNSPAGLAPSEAAHGNTEEAFTPQKFVSSLMSLGMSEEEAYELAGLRAIAKAKKAAGGTSGGFGPEHDDMYVTVYIPPDKGKFAYAPVLTSVNGVRIDIPRGVEFPIRVPYYTMLMDAVQQDFVQVMIPGGGLDPSWHFSASSVP